MLPFQSNPNPAMSYHVTISKNLNFEFVIAFAS